MDKKGTREMNANKQFDFYNPDSMYYANSKHYIAQLEAMSRQQQAEIDALKKSCLDEIFKRVYAERSVEVVSELYTHPVKELTEKYMEMLGVCKVFEDYLIGPTAWTQEQVDNILTQVRAILRKAGEK